MKSREHGRLSASRAARPLGLLANRCGNVTVDPLRPRHGVCLSDRDTRVSQRPVQALKFFEFPGGSKARVRHRCHAKCALARSRSSDES
jgi:hypothetical protein